MISGGLGLHVHEPRRGVFAFVGSIPLALAEMVPATSADVRGGRATRDERGQLVAPKFPTFTSRIDAEIYAAVRGFTVQEANK